MAKKITNLVFEGGGILGISYLGALEYLYKNNIIKDVRRTAGTSAGAITACILSFNLPFNEIKKITDTLEYKKIPQKEEINELTRMPAAVRKNLDEIFDDLECVYRLVKKYGWYSTKYFYNWLQEQIALQFDSSKKLPPYTFKDFKDTTIHKNNRPFLDLYIIGTDLSYKTTKIFSFETTPDMEVAEAVRISMSIPLFFEANKINNYDINKDFLTHVFSDGGIMRNYPINIFDTDKANPQTLGLRFKNKINYEAINSMPEFISNLFLCYLKIQQDMYRNSAQDIERSIEIDTMGISPVNFNINTGDETYTFLYNQGYEAAEDYFENKNIYYIQY
ncbi:patatin-like phospholipase family protein [Clostridium sp. SYSU_GA19001]|uniref:patatin-like phospholipase family protein n=1 Tax=Clostridium caldaquaticum TaxID=2940653 RepID=UPI0020773289|nr:patatin-like phospholipase family protein [Clostridium caldaquaticum]MCM8710291.1 patatin-like phospholipase family protein [Clostridium caldaquaticum]